MLTFSFSPDSGSVSTLETRTEELVFQTMRSHRCSIQIPQSLVYFLILSNTRDKNKAQEIKGSLTCRHIF